MLHRRRSLAAARARRSGSLGMMGALGAAASVSPTTVFAHPGHGSTPPETPLHYLLELPHALLAAPLVVVAGGVGLWLSRRLRGVERGRPGGAGRD